MSYTLESGTENSKVIFINSADKNVSLDTAGSSFMYNLDTPIIAPDNQECLVSLYSCVVPYSFYNIRENINDRIPYRFVANDNLDSVKIPKGNYTITTLSTAIKLLLDGIQGGVSYTIIYNRTTMKITYNSNTPTIYFDFSAFTDTAHIEMGFGQNEITPDTGISNLISTNVPDINGNTHQIQVRTNLASKGCLDSITKSYSTILGSIPIDVNFGGVIFSKPGNNLHKILITSKNITNISVRITDDRGRPINLNGLNFTISILLDFINMKPIIQQINQEERRIAENTIANRLLKIPKKVETRGRPRKQGRPKKEKTKIIID
tara:strand:- start:176 stop:1138 length:963 start_codon:yes stop_codon:yes gene_type:complete